MKSMIDGASDASWRDEEESPWDDIDSCPRLAPKEYEISTGSAASEDVDEDLLRLADSESLR